MKKTMALFTIAGLSMASEFDSADNELHLYKLQNGITALVHTVDDELRVLPIDYHPHSGNGPRVILADDELRIHPIDYHPPRQTRPRGGIWTDDELRIHPIDYHPPRQTRPNKPIMADDDDEFRSLPFDYIHSTKYGGPRTVFADDDELRVLPIDYHPSGPSRPHVIYTDDNDDELRVLPITYHPSGPSRPHVVYTDDNDDEFSIFPIAYLPPHSRPTHPIRTDDADDEFRAIPSDYTHVGHKVGKNKKPVGEIVQNDDELRLIGVGPGSLTHKKNVTETAKPIEVKPKRFTTGAVKLDKNITTNAADDEMRFAHFIPQYRPKREDVEKKAADNTLAELSDLLVETQRNGGFLRKGK